MTLDRYAPWLPEHRVSFCRWMEFVTRECSSMSGGSSRKHLIYYQAGAGEWWFDKKTYPSVDDAWLAVRRGFVEAIAYARAGEWERIEHIEALRSGWALVTKT